MPLGPISKFNEFYTTTRSAPMTDAKKLVNDAALNAYTASHLMKGKQPGQLLVDEGTDYTDVIKLSDTATYGTYEPGSKRNLTRVSTSKQISQVPRFCEAHVVYTEVEMLRNKGNDLRAKFKNFGNKLDMDLATDLWNGFEADFWRKPDAASMEDSTASPGKRLSIPALITENVGTNPYRAPGWGAVQSTIMGVNPNTEANWRNQRVTYDSADIHGDSGLFPAFDQMVRLLGFQPPPKDTQHFEADTSLDNLVIFTNGNGQDLFKKAQRAANDRFVRSNGDPAYSAIFEGRDVVWVPRLDVEQLDESAGAYTNQAYPAGKPRFFFVHRGYMWPWFAGGGTMTPTEPKSGGADQPDIYAIYRRVWGNLWGASRKRHGIVCPA